MIEWVKKSMVVFNYFKQRTFVDRINLCIDILEMVPFISVCQACRPQACSGFLPFQSRRKELTNKALNGLGLVGDVSGNSVYNYSQRMV